MTYYDIIKKLIGEIKPVGETNTDNIRLNNLIETIIIVEKLLFDISKIANCRNNHQYSMKKAGEKAYNFLKSIDLVEQ
jgi:hypothetical protein